jgi:S-adenosylmethionine uptake transporter
MRRQAIAAKPLEINFFQSLVVAAIWLAALPLVGLPRMPGDQGGWIIVASLMSTAGGLLFSWAYARADASYLAVTEYSAFLWAAALGWLVFREPVSLYTVAGAGLIVAGCLLAARANSAVRAEIEVAT